MQRMNATPHNIAAEASLGGGLGLTNSDPLVEAIARQYCQNLGLDPDTTQTLWKQNNLGYDQEIQFPLWHAMVQEAKEALAMHRAVRSVLKDSA